MTDLAELRKVAEAGVEEWNAPGSGHAPQAARLRFDYTFDPTTVLGLIDEIDRWREIADALAEHVRTLSDRLWQPSHQGDSVYAKISPARDALARYDEMAK